VQRASLSALGSGVVVGAAVVSQPIPKVQRLGSCSERKGLARVVVVRAARRRRSFMVGEWRGTVEEGGGGGRR